MLSQDKITRIFCSIDDFCKEFVPIWENQLITAGKKRLKKSNLSLSEIITIQVLFHISGYRIADNQYFFIRILQILDFLS